MTRTRKHSAAWQVVLLALIMALVAACAPDEDVAEDPADVEPPEEIDAEDDADGADGADESDEAADEDGDEAAADGDPIVIGGLATLEGAFAASGEDAFRGVEMAFEEAGWEVAGRPIEFVQESTDGSPDVAVDRARKLLEQDQVDFIIGPLSGSEGVALKDFIKDYPDRTMINGTSGAQETTFIDPAENFFRFGGDGAQWIAGLGEYVYEERGFRRVAILAEDYSFPYAQAAGFMIEFCGAGGEIADRFWVPIGTEDYSSVIGSLPDDIDGVFTVLGSADAVNFLTQLQEFGADVQVIGGSVTVDQTVLSAPAEVRDAVVGVPSANVIADNYDDAEWQEFVDRYHEAYPDGFASPSSFATLYYNAGLAAIEALEQVDGDLSDDQQAFQEALANLTLETPVGTIELDENRQAIAPNFVTEVAEADDGTLYNEVVSVVDSVPQTLGVDEEAMREHSPPDRDFPCTDDW